MADKIPDIGDIKGVGDKTASKLREAGFTNIESIAITSVRELMEKTGMSYETAWKVAEAARLIIRPDCVSAYDLYQRRQEAVRLTTGAPGFDQLLGGGIETQAVTEFVGEYAVGKSQLCMKLTVNCQLPRDEGGLEGRALFIDTEGTFSPERIHQMASKTGFNPEEVLKNIFYARAYNSDHQALLVDHVAKLVRQENIKLVVVDSVISHFRSEYVGRENLSERQQKLNVHLHKLLRLAEVFNIAVIVTNQAQANPQSFYGDPNRPAGGNILAHATTHRIYIRKGKKNTRVATVMDSPKLPEGKARFRIIDQGIEDVECKQNSEDEEEE